MLKLLFEISHLSAAEILLLSETDLVLDVNFAVGTDCKAFATGRTNVWFRLSMNATEMTFGVSHRIKVFLARHTIKDAFQLACLVINNLFSS